MAEEHQEHRKKFVSDVFYLTAGSHYSQFTTAISGLVIRAIIGPTLSGLQGLLSMIYLYFDYFYSPFRGGLAREVPYYKGVEDQKTVNDIRDGSFTIVALLSLILGIGLLVAGFLVKEDETGLLRWSIRIYAPISFLISINNYLTVFFRTEKKFFDLFHYNVFSSTLIAILTILFTYYFSFKGLLISTLIVNFVGTVYFFHLSKYHFRIHLPRKILKLLMVRGTPVILYSVVFMNFKQIDRLLIISMMGLTQMGYYSVGLMMCNLIYMIPASIWQVVFPGFLERGAKFKEDVSPLKGEVIHNTKTVADVIPIFFTISSFWMGFLIMYGLTAFIPGLVPSQILILGSFFIGLFDMFYYLFVIRDRIRHVVVASLILLFLAAFLDVVAIRLGTGLVGVAVATFLCFLLYSSVIIILGGILMLKVNILEMFRLLLRLYLPYIYALATYYPIARFLHPVKDHFWLDALRGLAGTAILLLLYLPFWIHVDRKTKLFTTFMGEMNHKYKNIRSMLRK
ncbi:MAG: oligosaccharide flippase family protein [Candidatus Sumerlaeota bacterium]|nr:oligosaccharide flippase family protein [Candidatus Sumerlaeota bacterium]